MIVPPRLIRAALAFLLFGTIAALLPAQDNAAMAGNGCDTGPAGSTGQLAIAATSSMIQDSYTLVPAAITYRIYFKPSAASPYATLNTGDATTSFVLNSGQVYVNTKTYSGANPPSIVAATFTAAQATVFANGKPANVAGSMTVTTAYASEDTQGNKIQYNATATFSAP